MGTLDITLNGIGAKSKCSTISIFIQWQDDSDSQIEAEIPHTQPNATAQVQQRTEAAIHDNGQSHTPQIDIPPPSNKRLRPTDRLVLSALRARVPQGKQMTKPVRLQELIDECAISRRQVQICLKRLIERGIVSRLLNEVNLGNQEGYRYKVSQEEIL